MFSLRAFILALELLFGVVRLSAPGQPARARRETPGPNPVAVGDVVLATGSPFASHLDKARAEIDKKDWAAATTLLQKLLDRKEDSLVVVTRKVPGGRGAKAVVGLRGEAERLLAGMPPEGHAFYQEEYGAEAAELVKQARMFNEPRRLAEADRRFLHTEAGAEAAERLAVRHADRDETTAAALAFDRLLLRTAPERLPARTLFKAAVAYRRAGADARAGEVWAHLERKVGKGTLEVGSRTLTMDDLRKERDRRAGAAAAAERDWFLFRGDPARSAQGTGGAPLLDPVWRAKTVREASTSEYVDRAVAAYPRLRRPFLAPFHPVTVRSKVDGADLPLVLTRSFWGVHAHVVRDLKVGDEEYRAGELFWELPSQWSVDRMLRSPQHIGALSAWLSAYLNVGVWPGVLFENTTLGALSTDGDRVYTVEDLMVPPPPNPFERFPAPHLLPQQLQDAVVHSRLHGIDLGSGKLVWEVGGKADGRAKRDLLDSFFLGPPLPFGEKLSSTWGRGGSSPARARASRRCPAT